MPFQHAAPWSQWLRGVFAGRSPGVQVVGQDIEDSLRGVVQVADVSNLAEPVGWAQANARRFVVGIVGDISRVELECVSPGGLWITSWFSTSSVTMEIRNAPVSVTTRGGIQDFGQVPTVSRLGSTTVTELIPDPDIWVFAATLFSGTNVVKPTGIYCPPGRTLIWRQKLLDQGMELDVFWVEIPARAT